MSDEEPSLLNPEPNGGYWTDKVRNQEDVGSKAFFRIVKVFLLTLAAGISAVSFYYLNIGYAYFVLLFVFLGAQGLNKLSIMLYEDYLILQKVRGENQ